YAPDLHLRRVESSQASGFGAQPPLSHFLPKECSGLSSNLIVPHADANERFAAESHVYAQRHALTELDRQRSVIKQRDHRPVFAAAVRQPFGPLPAPDRKDFAPNIIAIQIRKRGVSRLEPVSLHAHVVIGSKYDLTARSTDACVECRASALLSL